MKKVVVSNVFGPKNKGDFELFRQLVAILEEKGCKIQAITNNPCLSAQHFKNVQFCEQIGFVEKTSSLYYFKKIFYVVTSVLSTRLSLFEKLLPSTQRESLSAIKGADLVIGCPGGYLEDSRFSLYTQLSQPLIAVLLKKKLVLAPMSIGPIRSGTVGYRILAYILNRSDAVFLREPISYEFCQSLGVGAMLSPDLAFRSFSKNSHNRYTEKKWIAVTIINWNFPGADNPVNEKELYRERVVKAVEALATRFNAPVALINQVETDAPMTLAVAERLQCAHTVFDQLDTPEAVKGLLEKSYCLIASRFHSAIFALDVCCPVVALSYLPKTRGMLQLYGLEELCVDIDDFVPESLVSALIKQSENPEGCCKIKDRIITVNKQLGRKFEDYLVNL